MGKCFHFDVIFHCTGRKSEESKENPKVQSQTVSRVENPEVPIYQHAGDSICALLWGVWRSEEILVMKDEWGRNSSRVRGGKGVTAP